MTRVRLVRLPVIPIGILLAFYEFGAASLASEALAADSLAAQTEILPAPDAKAAAAGDPATAPPQKQPPVAVTVAGAAKTPSNKSPSILQMLDGHERELVIGAAVAVGFFLIGWISGGRYYVRRDRRRRSKLSF